MENVEYYVSPINIIDGEVYVLIKNNTEEVLEATSVFIKKSPAGCSNTSIELQPDSEILIKTEYGNKKISHFLWKDLDSITPLTTKRVMK